MSRLTTECCQFCGRPWTPGLVVKSDEHVLAQWIRRLEANHPSEQRSFSTGYQLNETSNEFVQVRPEIVNRRAALLTLKTREVCRDCNVGWMSDLEEDVKPTIRQLARSAEAGIAIVQSRQSRQRFAVWAQKTALTCELTSNAPRVGNVAMGQVLREGSPLPGSLVWIARHPDDYDISLGLEQIDVSATPVARPGPPDRRVLMVAITYHYMSILVFIADSRGQVWPQLSPTKWALVWPTFGLGLFEFPPMSAVTGTELTEIFTKPGRWIPPVQVSGIRDSELEPEVRYRN
jgi:hypothetical protein